MTFRAVQNNVIPSTSRDREVLALGYHQAASPVSKLARRGRYQTHTVRRIIQRLFDSGLLTTRAFVDIYRLGFTQFELCYAIASPSKKVAETFLRTLQQSPQVAWIGSYSGEYQYILTVCCKSPQELVRFIEETTANPDVSVTSRHLSVCVRYIEFPLTCFSERVREDKPLMFGVEGDERIDEKDHALLSLLSDNALLSTRELAARVNLSQSAVVQRIKSLERRKVITGYTYVLDFSRLGYQAFSIIVSTKKHTIELTNRIIAFAQKRRDILYVTESVGAYDYKFGVIVEKSSQILILAQEISEVFVDEIAWLTTLTAFEYKKVSRYPFKELRPSFRAEL